MINEYISLSEEASKAVLYIIAESNGYANECQSLADSPRKHASQLEEMKKKILAYGSTELVNLFFDSYNDVQITVENDANDIDSFKSYFYYMPLIASYIKYDLTGEIVNPSIFYNYINGNSYYHTFHGTKGLEFENVVVIMKEKNGQSKINFKDYFKCYDSSEEPIVARNLLYVVVTRAISNLRILYTDDIDDIRSNIEKIFGNVLEYQE